MGVKRPAANLSTLDPKSTFHDGSLGRRGFFSSRGAHSISDFRCGFGLKRELLDSSHRVSL